MPPDQQSHRNGNGSIASKRPASKLAAAQASSEMETWAEMALGGWGLMDTAAATAPIATWDAGESPRAVQGA